MERGKYSGKILIGSILAGVIYAIIGELLYNSLQSVLPGLVLIPIYFVGLFLFIGFAIWIIGKMVYSRYYKAVNLKQWFFIFLAMLACSFLFEFLYELEFKGKLAPSDAYIFVLDNSGSMIDNDPEGLRFNAVENLLSQKEDDFKYAVYTFADDATLVREMADKSAGSSYDHGTDEGGTAILTTLTKILSDIEEKRLVVDADNAHIILLSDGYATDIDMFNKYKCISILKDFAQKDITISTVGLLNADKNLMSMIATKTGGAFINVEDVKDLDDALVQAGNTGDEKWNLLGYRTNLKAGILYAFMRILFVTILGFIVGLQKTVICEKFLDTSAVLKSSIVGSALAGIGIEIGMNTLGIAPAITRTLVCILISFTLLKCDLRRVEGRGSEVYRG